MAKASLNSSSTTQISLMAYSSAIFIFQPQLDNLVCSILLEICSFSVKTDKNNCYLWFYMDCGNHFEK